MKGVNDVHDILDVFPPISLICIAVPQSLKPGFRDSEKINGALK